MKKNNELTKHLGVYEVINKINDFIKQDSPLQDEFIFIAANCFPKNTALRKKFLKLLRKNNPYYTYLYVNTYLLPRNKYKTATQLMEKAVQTLPKATFIYCLSTCYIEQKKYTEAKNLIKKYMNEDNMVTLIRVLCTITLQEKNIHLFNIYAKKLASLNSSPYYNIFLAEGYLEFKNYQKAIEKFNEVISDTRNLENTKLTPLIKKLYNDLKTQLQNYDINFTM